MRGEGEGEEGAAPGAEAKGAGAGPLIEPVQGLLESLAGGVGGHGPQHLQPSSSRLTRTPLCAPMTAPGRDDITFRRMTGSQSDLTREEGARFGGF